MPRGGYFKLEGELGGMNLSKMMKKENILSVNFFLTFLVIVVSGNLSIRVFDPVLIYIVSLVVILAVAFYRKVKLLNLDVIILVLFSLLLTMQVVEFGSFVSMASLGFIVKILIAMLVIRLVPNFLSYYILVMYILACMSLIFFIPVQLGIDLSSAFTSLSVLHESNYRTVIFLHNFHYDWQAMRNCGMFWEPGAFAGYLVLALLFYTWMNKGQLIVNKISIALFIALITTQSTTGFAAFFVLIVCHIYTSKGLRNPMLRMSLFPISLLMFLLIVFISFSQVDFLGGKIQSQLSDAAIGDKWSKINRFGNILYDIDYIFERPVIGWSANPESRFSIDSDLEELIGGMGNGLTGFVVRFGILGTLLCYAFLVASVYRVTDSIAVSFFSILVVCTLLMGEMYFDFPIFLTLWFMTKQVINKQNGQLFTDRGQTVLELKMRH